MQILVKTFEISLKVSQAGVECGSGTILPGSKLLMFVSNFDVAKARVLADAVHAMTISKRGSSDKAKQYHGTDSDCVLRQRKSQSPRQCGLKVSEGLPKLGVLREVAQCRIHPPAVQARPPASSALQ